MSKRQAAKLRKILAGIPFEPYYDMDSFVLYHGDYVKFLRTIKKNCIDMIFGDPPYHINKCYWDKSLGVERDFESQLEWIEVVKVVLKPDGSIWITGTHHSIFQCGFALQRLGFKIINDIVWFKPNGRPDCSRRCFSASHEMLLWAKKSHDAKHVYNYRLMKYRKWDGHIFKKPGKQMTAIWAIEPTIDFWAISSPGLSEKRQGRHPTQKPLALLRRIILASSRPGDIILDPFCGSSTTGIAAHELGRAFIGIDQEKEYLDLSIRRFETYFLESREGKKPVMKAGVLTD